MSLYKGYEKDIIVIMAGSLIGAAINLILPYISKYMVDTVVYMGIKEAIPKLVLLGIAHMIILLGNVFYDKVTDYDSSLLYAKVMSSLKESPYKKLHRLSFSWYDNIHTGKIINTLDSDTDNASHLVSDILPNLICKLLQLIGGIIVFFTISPIVMLYISPLLIIFNICVVPKLKSKFKKIREVVREQNELAEDELSGIRTTYSYGMEEYQVGKYVQWNTKIRDFIKDKWKFVFLYNAVSDAMSNLIYAGFMIIGTYLTIVGKVKITDILLFYMYFHIINNPIIWLRTLVKDVSKCFASYEIILNILDAEEEIKNLDNPIKIDLNIIIAIDYLAI